MRGGLKSEEVARNEAARKPSTAGPMFKTGFFQVKEAVTPESPPVQMLRVPKDVVVFSVAVCVQRQGRETLRLHVGDDDNPKRYLSGAVVRKGGCRLDATGAGSICDYGDQATIDVTVAEGVLEPGDTLRAVVGYASA